MKQRDFEQTDRPPIGKCVLCGDGTPAYRRAALRTKKLVAEVEKILGRKIKKADAGNPPRTPYKDSHPRIAVCNRHSYRIRVNKSAHRIRKHSLTEEQIAWVRYHYQARDRTIRDMAEELGVPYDTVWRRCHNDYVETAD